jgi:orotidine-5'-phosphate decarboxylase
MSSQIILALDVKDLKEVRSHLKLLQGQLRWVKCGMELFYANGSEVVKELYDMGFQVFLDLKLHDIPTTVKKASESLAKLPIGMLNFHIAGGSEMLKATQDLPTSIIRIGVTQLTSTSEERMQNEIGITMSMPQTVLRYTGLALDSGLHGVVCSPQDVKAIKAKFSSCITVCPGIRRAKDQSNDQVRIMTPELAMRDGADYLVIGRSILAAKDPVKEFQEISQEMGER